MTTTQETIQPGLYFPCFHDSLSSQDRHPNTSSCKFVIRNETIQHVVCLREARHYDTMPHLSSVTYHLNKNDLVSEVWESVSIQPLGSLYQLEKRTEVHVALQLASQMVEYFSAYLIPSERRFANLTKEKECINFLQLNAAFALNDKFEPRFITTNRHLLNSTPIPEKTKAKVLITQLHGVSNLVKVFLFSKNRKTSQKSIQPCNKLSCKLTSYTPRFLNIYNEQRLLDSLHMIYCESCSQLDIYENLHLALPVNAGILSEAIQFIQSI